MVSFPQIYLFSAIALFQSACNQHYNLVYHFTNEFQ
ncbi:unknown [[Mannheimia] succiniciproducens MBEL55E]|uniref:Uncharacterized protein n=1 Tax=Mannheimia succiniciproducens (strain KCTC 0769BP / MBEL55E) TaxID=221988 RepID=Q65UR3_MANSM|nr:unknown [[Mannheimia] succiniciproducens MBEL55E]